MPTRAPSDRRPRPARGRRRDPLRIAAARAWLRRALSPKEEGGVVAAAPVVALRDLLRRFWPDARPYKPWILLGLVFAVIVPLIEAAQIWIFQLVVDDVLIAGDLSPLVWIGLAYLGLTLAGAAIGFVDDYVAAWVGERFVLRLRTRVFAHLQKLAPDTLDKRRLGDLVSRLTSDVQAIEAMVLAGLSGAVSAVFRILIFGAALFVLDWRLALVSLVVAPFFFLVAKSFSRLSKRAAREKRRRGGSLSAVAEGSLGNLALVQASNGQAAELERFRREGEGIVQAELAATRVRGVFTPLVDLIELAAAMLVVGLGTWAVTEGRLTVGGLLVFLTYLTQLYSPARELASLSTAAFAAAAGAERVTELMDDRLAVEDRVGARRMGRSRGYVGVEDVWFRYPGAATASLRGVSLSVKPGQTVAIVGPSGAGKSTLAKLLLRFHDPESGAVRLDGHDLRDLTVDSVRENVAVLLQEALVLHGTVRENIAFARPDAADEEIRAAAIAADADEFIRALPDGYDTIVGQRGRRLSGGQRQRLAMARVLLRDAPVLLLDEPHTGLDGAARERLVPALERLMRDRTTLVISHDLLSVHSADLIVVLEDGRVVEQGSHEDLLAAGGVYTRLFRARAEVEDSLPAGTGVASA